MEKTFKKIKVGIGLAALATLFAFNLHHAVVYHYGVLNLNFSQNWQVYAQTNSAGAGGDSHPGGCSHPGGVPPNLVQHRITGEGVVEIRITFNAQGIASAVPIFGQCCEWTGNISDWCDADMIPVCMDGHG